MIVNNAGQYEAAITRRITTESEVYKKTTSQGKYILFNTDNTVELPERTSENTVKESSIRVEYFPLRIEKNDHISANAACEAFGRIIMQRTVPANSPYTKWQAPTVNKPTNKDYSKPQPYPSTVYNKEPKKTGDYYGSLFEEYGIQRGKANSFEDDDEKYDDFVKESEQEILEEQSKYIDWDSPEYLLFVEKLFFGSPFISNPKCKDFRTEIEYVAKTFNNACNKTFGNTVSMKDWFSFSLDYCTNFIEFPQHEVLPEYDEYFDDYEVVIYHIAQELRDLKERYEYITVAIDLLESRI